MRERIEREVNESVDKIIGMAQIELGIQHGDVTPEIEESIGNVKEMLTDIIINVLKSQM